MRYGDYLIKTSESSWPRVLDRVTPYTTLGGGIWNAIRANKRSKKEGRTGFKRALDVLKGGAKGSLYGFLAGQVLDPAQMYMRGMITGSGDDALGSSTVGIPRPYDLWLVPNLAIRHGLKGGKVLWW